MYWNAVILCHSSVFPADLALYFKHRDHFFKLVKQQPESSSISGKSPAMSKLKGS